MAKIEGQTFTNIEINLDADQYENCTFIRCRIFYAGTVRQPMVNCKLEDCGIGYDGAAKNMLGFLSALYHSGDFGKLAVDTTFLTIRHPGPNPPPLYTQL